MIFKMSLKKRFAIFILRVINDHSPFVVIFIDVINLFNINKKENEKEKSFETFISNILHTSILKSNVFQALKPHFKRLKIKIFYIYKHINMRDN